MHQSGALHCTGEAVYADEMLSHGSVARAFVVLAGIVLFFAAAHVHAASIDSPVFTASVVLCYSVVAVLVFSPRIKIMKGARAFLRRHLRECNSAK